MTWDQKPSDEGQGTHHKLCDQNVPRHRSGQGYVPRGTVGFVIVSICTKNVTNVGRHWNRNFQAWVPIMPMLLVN